MLELTIYGRNTMKFENESMLNHSVSFPNYAYRYTIHDVAYGPYPESDSAIRSTMHFNEPEELKIWLDANGLKLGKCIHHPIFSLIDAPKKYNKSYYVRRIYTLVEK